MVKTWASTVVTVLGCFAALAVHARVHAQTPPAISTDSQGNVTVTGNDLTVVAGGMAAISVRQLAADVEALKSATAVLQNLTALFPTTQEVSSNTPNMHEAMQRASRPRFWHILAGTSRRTLQCCLIDATHIPSAYAKIIDARSNQRHFASPWHAI